MPKSVEFKSGYNFRPAIEAGIAKFKAMNENDQTRAAALDKDIEDIQLFSNPSVDLMAYFLDKYAEVAGEELFSKAEFDFFTYKTSGQARTVINNIKYQRLVKTWYDEATDDSIKVFLKMRCGGLLETIK